MYLKVAFAKMHFVHQISFCCRCVEAVKASHYVELANDLEINKATTYLRQRDFNQVWELFTSFFFLNMILSDICGCSAFFSNSRNNLGKHNDYIDAAH